MVCTVGYGLYSGLWAVQWATGCTVGYGLYSGLRAVQWAMASAVGYGIYSGLWAVQWATASAVGYGLYIGLRAVQWATGCTTSKSQLDCQRVEGFISNIARWSPPGMANILRALALIVYSFRKKKILACPWGF